MDIRDQMEFWAFRSLIGGLRCLPYVRARHLMSGMGVFAGRVLRIRRSVVTSQLSRIYPNETRKSLDSLADLVYHHLGLTVAEIFCGDPQALMEAVRIDPGWDEVDQAIAHGRGAIVATGHIGNFELGGATLARRYHLLDVVKTQRNVPFDRYIEAMHQRLGIETVPMQQSASRVLRHLPAGGMVSLLMDQDAGDRGMTVPFLGQPAATWPGIARISIRTGCPVIPMALVRNPAGGHELKISSPLLPNGYSEHTKDVRCYLEKISAAMEVFIREYPEQWFWVHRRWKSRKGGHEIQQWKDRG